MNKRSIGLLAAERLPRVQLVKQTAVLENVTSDHLHLPKNAEVVGTDQDGERTLVSWKDNLFWISSETQYWVVDEICQGLVRGRYTIMDTKATLLAEGSPFHLEDDTLVEIVDRGHLPVFITCHVLDGELDEWEVGIPCQTLAFLYE